MNITKRFGGFALEVKGITIKVGEVQTEMTDVSVAEYLDILKQQKEIFEQVGEIVHEFSTTIKEALSLLDQGDESGIEALLKQKMQEQHGLSDLAGMTIGSIQVPEDHPLSEMIQNLINQQKEDGDNQPPFGFSFDNNDK